MSRLLPSRLNSRLSSPSQRRRALWQWARRRHPKKSRAWVKKHYFPAQRNRAWMFAVKTGQRTAEGQPIWLRLVYAGETKIRRHVKIRQDANPFDPQWKSYFVDRAFHKKFGIHRQQAGIKTVVKPAPLTRGFETA